jgi:putative oxidoreductase
MLSIFDRYRDLAPLVLRVFGLFTRPAAAVVVVNFAVALLMVHVGQPFNANIAPLAMLVGGLFFVLYGAPRYSLDAALARRGAGGA